MAEAAKSPKGSFLGRDVTTRIYLVKEDTKEPLLPGVGERFRAWPFGEAIWMLEESGKSFPLAKINQLIDDGKLSRIKSVSGKEVELFFQEAKH